MRYNKTDVDYREMLTYELVSKIEIITQVI